MAHRIPDNPGGIEGPFNQAWHEYWTAQGVTPGHFNERAYLWLGTLGHTQDTLSERWMDYIAHDMVLPPTGGGAPSAPNSVPYSNDIANGQGWWTTSPGGLAITTESEGVVSGQTATRITDNSTTSYGAVYLYPPSIDGAKAVIRIFIKKEPSGPVPRFFLDVYGGTLETDIYDQFALHPLQENAQSGLAVGGAALAEYDLRPANLNGEQWWAITIAFPTVDKEFIEFLIRPAQEETWGGGASATATGGYTIGNVEFYWDLSLNDVAGKDPVVNPGPVALATPTPAAARASGHFTSGTLTSGSFDTMTGYISGMIGSFSGDSRVHQIVSEKTATGQNFYLIVSGNYPKEFLEQLTIITDDEPHLHQFVGADAEFHYYRQQSGETVWTWSSDFDFTAHNEMFAVIATKETRRAAGNQFDSMTKDELIDWIFDNIPNANPQMRTYYEALPEDVVRGVVVAAAAKE